MDYKEILSEARETINNLEYIIKDEEKKGNPPLNIKYNVKLNPNVLYATQKCIEKRKYNVYKNNPEGLNTQIGVIKLRNQYFVVDGHTRSRVAIDLNMNVTAIVVEFEEIPAIMRNLRDYIKVKDIEII